MGWQYLLPACNRLNKRSRSWRSWGLSSNVELFLAVLRRRILLKRVHISDLDSSRLRWLPVWMQLLFFLLLEVKLFMWLFKFFLSYAVLLSSLLFLNLISNLLRCSIQREIQIDNFNNFEVLLSLLRPGTRSYFTIPLALSIRTLQFYQVGLVKRKLIKVQDLSVFKPVSDFFLEHLEFVFHFRIDVSFGIRNESAKDGVTDLIAIFSVWNFKVWFALRDAVLELDTWITELYDLVISHLLSSLLTRCSCNSFLAFDYINLLVYGNVEHFVVMFLHLDYVEDCCLWLLGLRVWRFLSVLGFWDKCCDEVWFVFRSLRL